MAAQEKPTPDPHWVRQSLPVAQELAAVMPFDLDGDGRKDLVVLEADRSHSRDVPYTLHVFRLRAAGYSPLPGAEVALPLHVSLAAVGAFRGGPGLAMLLPGMLEVWPWRSGRFRPQAAQRLALDSLFPVPNGELKVGFHWLTDLNGDGVDELLVPRFDGVAVVQQDAQGRLRLRALLKVRGEARLLDSYRRSMLAWDLPTVAVQQVDGTGWKDVVLYQDGVLSVFLLDGSLDGGPLAPALVRDLQPPEPFDPTKPWDPPMRLISAEDLNGDGHFDLIFTKNTPTDSQANTRTEVLIYYGRPGSGGAPIDFSVHPDQVYYTEGFSLPLVLDVNADGRKDLVMVNVEIGFWNVIKALISRSVNAQAAFYLMPADGRYPRDPQYLHTYEVNFSLGHFSHHPIADFGDLNGDGLPDLMLSEDKETLGLHWGHRNGVWSSEPDARLHDLMPISGARVLTEDLDGDGRTDLIFAYDRDDIRQMPQVNHTFVVLRSRYGKPNPSATKGTDAPPRRRQGVFPEHRR